MIKTIGGNVWEWVADDRLSKGRIVSQNGVYEITLIIGATWRKIIGGIGTFEDAKNVLYFELDQVRKKFNE